VEVRAEAGAAGAEPDVAIDDDDARRDRQRAERRDEVRQLAAIERARLVRRRRAGGLGHRLQRGHRIRSVVISDARGDDLRRPVVDIDAVAHEHAQLRAQLAPYVVDEAQVDVRQ
jgi:hypothetical protein